MILHFNDIYLVGLYFQQTDACTVSRKECKRQAALQGGLDQQTQDLIKQAEDLSNQAKYINNQTKKLNYRAITMDLTQLTRESVETR